MNFRQLEQKLTESYLSTVKNLVRRRAYQAL